MYKYKQLGNNSNETFSYHPNTKIEDFILTKLKKTIINKISYLITVGILKIINTPIDPFTTKTKFKCLKSFSILPFKLKC